VGARRDPLARVLSNGELRAHVNPLTAVTRGPLFGFPLASERLRGVVGCVLTTIGADNSRSPLPVGTLFDAHVLRIAHGCPGCQLPTPTDAVALTRAARTGLVLDGVGPIRRGPIAGPASSGRRGWPLRGAVSV